MSAREFEAMRLIAIGLSNRETSDHLDVPVPTVKRHPTNQFGKRDAADRAEAVFKTRTHGIV